MNGSRQEPDIHDRLEKYFRDIAHILRGVSEGRGSQKRILMIVQKAGSITQSELTERLHIQYGSASEVIGKLEASGLILGTPNETDKRTTNISLTQAGEAAARQAWQERQERHAHMFVCLSEEEKIQLASLLQKVDDAWEQEYGGAVSQRRKGHGRHRHEHHEDICETEHHTPHMEIERRNEA